MNLSFVQWINIFKYLLLLELENFEISENLEFEFFKVSTILKILQNLEFWNFKNFEFEFLISRTHKVLNLSFFLKVSRISKFHKVLNFNFFDFTNWKFQSIRIQISRSHKILN